MNADVHARDVDKHTPLHTVISVATIQLLIDHNADVNAIFGSNGNTRLHCEEEPAIIQCLIKNGADVTMQNKDGCTPLHCAVDDAVLQSIVENAARYMSRVAPPQSKN
jgi:ankyrin repeat protein